MSTLYPARVVAIAPEADSLYDLHVDVSGTPIAGTHAHPGQYVLLSLDEHEPQPFAIASEPGATELEFLVKGGSPLSDALTRIRPGQRVRLTMAQGPGFPLERAKGQEVLLFATGSGISAIRSTLLSIRQHRGDYADVTLFFGARTPTAFAYLDEHSEWEADRIQVVRTVSQPGESGWTGLTGYVQQHLSDVGHPGAIAFVCGQPDMVKGVTEALQRNGVPTENVFLNF
ncbi:MAG: NAD-binding oxidoreductase [Myxococcaceae bacterium]